MLERQIDNENDDDENVPLHYHINKDFSIRSFWREEFNWVKPITGIDIANMIVDKSFAQLYDDDAQIALLSSIIALCYISVEIRRVNANVKRWSPLSVAEPTNEDDVKTYSIFGYTWAFKTWILKSFRVTAIRYFDRYNRYPRVAAWSKKKGRFLGDMVIPFFQGNMPAARLTPDDNEALSALVEFLRRHTFDGFIGIQFDEHKREIERNKKEVDNIKKEMHKFRQKMNVQPVRQENKEPINVDQHYGLSDFSQFQSMQGGPSSFQRHVNSLYFNMGTAPNFQTPMPSQPGSSVWQRQMPAQSATQYWQPDTSSQHGSYYSFGHVPSHMGRQNLQTNIENASMM
ncbi:hypothetical protein Tco_0752572 [Tanacetum coccineum]|uniref:Uncharacterized protein n=1 Tax=Tanacetum coccineum TaxID=301880 RepID=A0ABQ4Z8G7_9ASTR